MGSGGMAQFCSLHKYLLNWLSDEYVRTVNRSETNRLYGFDATDLVAGRIYALRIRKDYDREYWVDFRQRLTGNPWLANGVELHWDSWEMGEGTAQLLDTTPGSSPGRTDAAVVLGRTYVDEGIPLYLTPVAKAALAGTSDRCGGADGLFPHQPRSDPHPDRQRPVRRSGTTVDFQADAGDVNGDKLAYYWEFSDGSFYTGTQVRKTLNAAGYYVARCEVSDMKGGLISKHLVVRVGDPTTFAMSGRVVDDLGQPVRGVRVHNGFSGGAYRNAYTDSDGLYTMTGIVSGLYTNRAFLYGYNTARWTFPTPFSLPAPTPSTSTTWLTPSPVSASVPTPTPLKGRPAPASLSPAPAI